MCHLVGLPGPYFAALGLGDSNLRKAMSEEQSAARTEFSIADKLACERTRLAYGRTMMTWSRTSTVLITFGFGAKNKRFYV